MDHDREPQRLGWDAIDNALRQVYGNEEPRHWGTLVPYAVGGPDPLTGLSAYFNDTGEPHWHFITYGFSELYEKESDNLDLSGYGFELTFRIAANRDDDHSNWIFNFLQNLARYTFQTGRCFGAGHTLPLNGPIQSEYDTEIQAVSFALDPQLGSITTPNGNVDFLQIVGITLDELGVVQKWDATAFLKLVSAENPLLITDLDRKSYLADAGFRTEVQNRTSQEGSSCGEMGSSEFSYSKSLLSRTCTLRLGALLVDGLTSRICGRIPFGREMLLTDGDVVVSFLPGQQNAWSMQDKVLEVTLNAETAHAFRRLVVPTAGCYTVPGLNRFQIEVTKTDIRDQQGNVLETLG